MSTPAYEGATGKVTRIHTMGVVVLFDNPVNGITKAEVLHENLELIPAYPEPQSVGNDGRNFIDLDELKYIVKTMKAIDKVCDKVSMNDVNAPVYGVRGELLGHVRLWTQSDGDQMLGFIPVNGGWRS
jgi:hypothetical protein